MKLQDISRCIEVLDEVIEILPDEVIDEQKLAELHKIQKILNFIISLQV